MRTVMFTAKSKESGKTFGYCLPFKSQASINEFFGEIKKDYLITVLKLKARN